MGIFFAAKSLRSNKKILRQLVIKAPGIPLPLMIVGVGLALGTMGCGVPQPTPKTKSSESVDLPSYPLPQSDSLTDGHFGLRENDGTQVYDGRLIFWNPSAGPSGMARVHMSTVAGRQNKTRALGYAEREVLPARKEVENAQAIVAQRQKELLDADQKGLRNPETLAKAQSEFFTWFPRTLSRIESMDPGLAPSRSLIEERWQAYCDGKVWEMATSALALKRFTHRPTPLALCEAYFEDKGYFQNDALCGPDQGGKSYFECLWKEGSLKTPQWLATISDPSTEKCAVTQKLKKDVLAAWLDARVEQESGDNAQRSDLSKLETLLADSGTRQLFAAAVMGGGRFSKAIFSEKAMELLGQCPTALEKKGGFEAPRLDRAPPQRLLWIVEHTFPGNLTSKEPLLPLREDGMRTQDRLVFDQLTAFVKRLGLRFAQTSGLRVSVSDVLFNEPLENPLTNQSEKNEEGDTLENAWSAVFPQDPSQADPLIRPLLSDETAQKAPLVIALRSAEETLKSRQKIWDEKKIALGQLLDQEQGATAEGLKAVNNPGTTVYFSTFRFKMTHQDKIMFVELAIDEPMTQCVVLEEGGACPAPNGNLVAKESLDNTGALPSVMNPDLRASFDPTANKLTLELNLKEPERYGFKGIPRKPEDLAKALESPLLRFNDQADENWKNRTLILELYGSKLDGTLDIFSGQAFLKEGELKVLEGSLVGDRFAQALRQLGI